MDVTMVPHKRWANSSFQSTTTSCFVDVTMVPHERWANSSFNQPQLVVYGCYHGFSWEMGPTQVSINHNWLFMDVTMVPHERLDNYLKFQSTTTGCFLDVCHGSLWEMCQLKFQSSTTGLWMLPWFLMRDGPTQLSILHNWLFMDVSMVPHERWANSSVNQPQLVVYGCYHGSS